MRARLLLALTLVTACARERAPNAPACVAWREDVAPVVAAACGACHDGDLPDGNYDLGSYLGALSGGTDEVPNAIAGEPSSQLLVVLDPSTATAPHQAADVQQARALLATWVEDCDLAYFRSPIHENGIMNRADQDFHGTLVRDLGYDFPFCAGCHGDDFTGGDSGASCRTCHEDGPTDCTTCHRPGFASMSGAHAAHLLGRPPFDKVYDCSECHLKPEVYSDVGHLFLADGTLDPTPAEVTLGATAALTPPFADRTGPPTFDKASLSCANVYCHGGAFDDTAAGVPAPVWTGGDAQTTCAGCHGAPPARHGTATACATCHPNVSGGGEVLLSTTLHVDGQLDLGNGSGDCMACHGGPAGPAPPRDLAGNSSYSALGVGAHQTHLTAPHRVSAPLACATCHIVPTEVDSPAHVDTDMPAEVTFGVAAAGLGGTPMWDRVTGACTGACHGDTSPVWTTTPSDNNVFCGSCHGVPTVAAYHMPTFELTDCALCHGGTVDAFGNILVTGPPDALTSLHMNGVADYAP